MPLFSTLLINLADQFVGKNNEEKDKIKLDRKLYLILLF